MGSPDLRMVSQIIPVSYSEWKTESSTQLKGTLATAAESGSIQWGTMKSLDMDARRIDS